MGFHLLRLLRLHCGRECAGLSTNNTYRQCSLTQTDKETRGIFPGDPPEVKAIAPWYEEVASYFCCGPQILCDPEKRLLSVTNHREQVACRWRKMKDEERIVAEGTRLIVRKERKQKEKKGQERRGDAKREEQKSPLDARLSSPVQRPTYSTSSFPNSHREIPWNSRRED